MAMSSKRQQTDRMNTMDSTQQNERDEMEKDILNNFLPEGEGAQDMTYAGGSSTWGELSAEFKNVEDSLEPIPVHATDGNIKAVVGGGTSVPNRPSTVDQSVTTNVDERQQQKPHRVGSVRFPQTELEIKQIEDALAEEFDNLNLVEKEKIVFEAHGFNEPPPEDEMKLNELLTRMEEKIVKSKSNKEAYTQAKYLNDEYVTDRAFRTMFLRSENYDPKKAGEKLILHFHMKREIFGSGDVLAREIRLSDLSEEDMKVLESGFMQVLPTRDAAGRSIICVTPRHDAFKQSDSVARTVWYMFTTTLRDEETQKKGVVVIIFNDGVMPRFEELKMMKRVHWVRRGIPKKIAGGHYCYSDASLRPFVAGIRLFMDKESRHRVRPLSGTHEDIMFKLQTYGIDTKDHPLQENGELSLAYHREWLQIRKSQEAENKSTKDDITVPRRFDVLFGRGKNTREHSGNLRATHLVDMHMEKYEAANKFQKTEIAERIVSIIYESYGRFLKWENDCWVEVDHNAAREKISHFFRHARSKQKATITNNDGSHSDAAQAPTHPPTAVKRVTPCPSPNHTGGAAIEDDHRAKHLRDHL